MRHVSLRCQFNSKNDSDRPTDLAKLRIIFLSSADVCSIKMLALLTALPCYLFRKDATITLIGSFFLFAIFILHSQESDVSLCFGR